MCETASFGGSRRLDGFRGSPTILLKQAAAKLAAQQCENREL
jgi:hypothetical protein